MRRSVGYRGRGQMFVVAASLAGLSGCKGFFTTPANGGGGGKGGAAGANLVYVANAAAQSISGWVIGTGTLTAVAGLPGPLNFAPASMAVSRANTFVWISDGGQFINSYTIGSGGTLNAPTTAAASGETALDVSPDGQWLAGLSPLTQTLDIFQINQSTGALGLVAQAPLPISTVPITTAKMVRFAPNGAYIFAALGTAGTAEYAFSTGSGSPGQQAIGQIQPGSATSDNAVLINGSSTAMYIARSGSNQVLGYGIGTNGALAPITGSPFAAGGAPYDLAITGSNLYVANRNDGTVGGYAIGASGALTGLTGSPFGGGSAPQSLAVDATGTYLFAAGNGGKPDLTMWSLTSGALTPVTTKTPATNDGSSLVATTH